MNEPMDDIARLRRQALSDEFNSGGDERALLGDDILSLLGRVADLERQLAEAQASIKRVTRQIQVTDDHDDRLQDALAAERAAREKAEGERAKVVEVIVEYLDVLDNAPDEVSTSELREIAAQGDASQEKEPEPEMWRCEACGEDFDSWQLGHSRAEHAHDCDGTCRGGCPVEVQCGPISRVGPPK